MKTRNQCNRIRGLTLVEVVVVIVIVGFLALLLLPAGTPQTARIRLACRANLIQVRACELMWARDHLDRFPSQVSTNQGGTLEYLATGRLDLHYQALQLYLPSVKVVCCPADTRIATTNYASLKNENISYFASLDASPSNASFFMAGDRNLMINGAAGHPGTAALTATSSAGWSKEMHNSKTGKKVGNIAFSDGHVESVSEDKLPALNAKLGVSTNRLVFP
jgi:prepilin-type N-terminal cleavage/methylation domain-containing protein/prepilin-type processing-associated H-X9-DG protein